MAPKVVSFTASSVPVAIPNDATGIAAATVVGTLAFSDNNTTLGPWTVELVASSGDNASFQLAGAAMGVTTIAAISSTVDVQAGASGIAWASLRNKATLVVRLTDVAGNSVDATIDFAGASFVASCCLQLSTSFSLVPLLIFSCLYQ